MKIKLLVLSYLSAIVAANLFVTHFGKTGLMITSFLLIPFDLFSRDLLHAEWQNRRLYLRMFLLITAGGIISYLINNGSARIAVASCASFFVAASIDTYVYQWLHRKRPLIKMTASNLASSIVDSILFISIAFAFDVSDISLQSACKFTGALLWTILYLRIKK